MSVATPQVELQNVTKIYGNARAVDSVTLSIPKGEIVSFLGPSGCGKTTTLNMIAGFLPVDGGEIRLGGRPIQGVPPHKRNTAMVFQSYALFPHLTVFENVAFGLRLRKVAAPEIERRVRTALELVRLPNVEKRYPKELSGGQQQRVSLARALVIEPDVLLLDEPLSNLDAKLRAEMRTEIVDIQRRLGITAIFVTHDQEEALAISDRIVVMNNGHVEQIGTAEEIYNRPATAFVAHFIGEVNDLHATVAGRDGRFTVAVDGRGTSFRGEASATLPEGAPVRVLVRPERIDILPTGASGADKNHLQGRVDRITYLGSVTRYRVEAGGESLIVSRPNRGQQTVFAEGAEVDLAWDPTDTLLALDREG